MEFTRRQFIATGACLIASPGFAADKQQKVFVGSYQGTGKSAGIHSFQFNPQTGAMSQPELAIRTRYPGNLYVHPDGETLYSGSGDEGLFEGTHFLSSYKIDGLKLRELNKKSSGGFRPSHGSVDSKGKYLVIPNYRSDNIVAFNLNDDGSLGDMAWHVGKPLGTKSWRARGWDKPHIALFSGNERYVVVAEINRDRLKVYRFNDENGALEYHSEERTQNSSGPRHISFHPSYRYVYSSDEEGSTISAFTWDEQNGALKHFQTTKSIPYGFNNDNDPSHIEVDPTGRFLYMANCGHNSIVMCSIDQNDGSLSVLGHFPLRAKSWCFQIDPTGTWILVANITAHNVVSLKIDQDTGLLFRSGHEIEISNPACLRIV